LYRAVNEIMRQNLQLHDDTIDSDRYSSFRHLPEMVKRYAMACRQEADHDHLR
jgi:hypothetical protein